MAFREPAASVLETLATMPGTARSLTSDAKPTVTDCPIMVTPRDPNYRMTAQMNAPRTRKPVPTNADVAGNTGERPATASAVLPAGSPPRGGAQILSRRQVERAVEENAARQHGVVSRGQLRAAGVSAHIVDNLVKRGQLRAMHRGVYQVGPLVAARAREMGAVLASGAHACISHRSAAVLWQLLSPGKATAGVELIVRGRHRPVRAGVVAHREPTLRGDEVTDLDGIRLTTAARTLLDLAGIATSRELERALARAEREHPTAWDVLPGLLQRHPRHRGSRRLRAILGSGTAPALTRSEAEERLLDLIRRAQLPEPETNVRIQGLEVERPTYGHARPRRETFVHAPC